jgi:hypothetical protein
MLPANDTFVKQFSINIRTNKSVFFICIVNKYNQFSFIIGSDQSGSGLQLLGFMATNVSWFVAQKEGTTFATSIYVAATITTTFESISIADNANVRKESINIMSL